MAVLQTATAAPSPAVAPPPGNPRFELFDSLRAIAVLAVLTFHVTSLTGALTDRVIGNVFGILGTEGLTLFFVISGFLLYRPYVAARAAGRPLPSTRRYARRRALRIVPAYWAALTVLAVFPGLLGVFTGDWWRYYFFLQLYFGRTVNSGIPVAWTLCVEVSFYALLPLWAAAIRRVAAGRRASWVAPELAGLALLALLGAVIQLLASRQVVSSTLASSLLGECIWFALGMALAVLSVAESSRGARPGLGPGLARAAVGFVRDHSGLCWVGAIACLLGVAAVLHPGGLLNILLTVRTRQPIARTLGAIALTGALMALLVSPAVFGEAAGGLPRRILRAAPLGVARSHFLRRLPVAPPGGGVAGDEQRLAAFLGVRARSGRQAASGRDPDPVGRDACADVCNRRRQLLRRRVAVPTSEGAVMGDRAGAGRQWAVARQRACYCWRARGSSASICATARCATGGSPSAAPASQIHASRFCGSLRVTPSRIRCASCVWPALIAARPLRMSTSVSGFNARAECSHESIA